MPQYLHGQRTELEKKRLAVLQKIRDVERKLSTQQQKQTAKERYVVGEAVLTYAKTDKEFATRLATILEAGVTRKHDAEAIAGIISELTRAHDIS